MKKTICLKYPAIFEVNSDGISISFPNIPECLSCAFTKGQARKMAKEALKLALHGIKVEELPAQGYPVKRFTSKEFYIRTVVVKIEIRDNRLFDKDVVEFFDTEGEELFESIEKASKVNNETNI